MCLHVYDWLLVVVVESNPSVHFCVQERNLFKWRMIIAVVRNFMQLRKESLKKIQVCTTGFEPLTSAIPVQRSVNLAVASLSIRRFWGKGEGKGEGLILRLSCCCHLSHEFYRRVTVICLFHKALSFVYLSRLVFHRLITLGARDFSCVASGFGKVSV